MLSSKWNRQPFGHNRHGPKIGGLCPFWGELSPHLTQCGLGRGLPPYQVASWSIQPFGHNTPTLQTDSTGQDKTGQTDGTMVRQQRANRFTNGRPKNNKINYKCMNLLTVTTIITLVQIYFIIIQNCSKHWIIGQLLKLCFIKLWSTNCHFSRRHQINNVHSSKPARDFYPYLHHKTAQYEYKKLSCHRHSVTLKLNMIKNWPNSGWYW